MSTLYTRLFGDIDHATVHIYNRQYLDWQACVCYLSYSGFFWNHALSIIIMRKIGTANEQNR